MMINHDKPLDLGVHYSQTNSNMAALFYCYEFEGFGFFKPMV